MTDLPQLVQTPHQHDVDLSAARGFQQFLALFPLGRARADVFHLQSDPPAPAGGVFPQGAVLQGESLLVVRGHAGVETHPQPGRGLFRRVAQNL